MRSGKVRLWAFLGLAAVSIAFAFWWWGPGAAVNEHPMPPIAKSEALNAETSVGYVGSALCKECHQDHAASHAMTQHSLALREVASFEQPAGAEFTHELSGRRYRVYDSPDGMRHREYLPSADGELVLADYAPSFAMGSGSHSYTYLCEIDGFLTESPITYYNPKSKWDLSPGYAEQRDHPGFSRPINTTCVNCHSGGVTDVESLYKFTIRERAISCERCHGPGELHVDKWLESEEELDGPDPTIVNPARLPDDRLDGVCSQCHLEGVARVAVRGRKEDDYRPGLRFEDFEIAYRLSSEDEMKVVGHVEQMKLSVCYHRSPSMTCITCHDPHDTPTAEDRIAYFRDACLQCHEEASCGLTEAERVKQSPEDDCNSCHMPKSKVNVPHVAFTDHRIGIHGERAKRAIGAGDIKLVPLNDVSHLPEIERERCLGLAYLEVSSIEANAEDAREFAVRARLLLEGVRGEGLRDAAIDSALSRIYLAEKQASKAIRYAGYALAYDEVSPSIRIDALDVIATAYCESEKLSKARPYLEQLCKLRRHAEDWRRLGRARFAAGEKEGAEEAAVRAVEIAPHRAELQHELSGLYRALGNKAKADKRQKAATVIERSAQ